MRYSAASDVRPPRRPLHHAVVLGGSIAGLLAARTLSDHFDRVTVLERDYLAHASEPRKGTPQGNHLHALLARGRIIAEALLPGLSDDLVRAGALRINGGRDLAWHHSGNWRARHDSELSFLSMSRPLLESFIREHVRTLRNVTLIDGVRVTGLCIDANRTVKGVRFIRQGSSAQTSEIDGDLVIDAMGRGSPTPQWLTEVGFDAPAAELIGARVAYATSTFRRTAYRPAWRALIITGRPGQRGGVIFPIEGNRWLVTLPGFFDEKMPQDHGAFLEYARSLDVPDLHEMIRGCEPLSDVKRYRFAGSLRHRYENLERFPEGLIVLGDAVSSFNPLYGQGMTVAAIEAETLARALAEAKAEGGLDRDFSRRWFHVIKSVVDAAWNGALLEDFRLPQLVEQRPFHLRPMQWYMERVQRATHRSAFVTNQFYRVINFLDPPSRLFSGRMLAEVALAATSVSRSSSDQVRHRSAGYLTTTAQVEQ